MIVDSNTVKFKKKNFLCLNLRKSKVMRCIYTLQEQHLSVMID